jgi:rhomboid family GlyGly-CTERM serine protease
MLSFIAQLAGAGVVEMLQFERDAIAAGQWWRLVTGHLIHLGWSHWALNLAGLAILGLAFRASRPTRRFDADCKSSARPVAGLVILMLGTGIGLFLLNSELGWYRGLSGVLQMGAVGRRKQLAGAADRRGGGAGCASVWRTRRLAVRWLLLGPRKISAAPI